MGGLLVAFLTLPTLAITTARLQSGDSLWWVILRACAPVAIIPYALAVVVLVVLSWGFRSVARPVALPVLAVVTALLLLHVWWFVRPFLADAPGAATGDRFAVMTANLHIGHADPAAILDAVDREGVDILVLEEITPSALAGLDRLGLERRLNHRAGTAEPNRDGIMLFANVPLQDVTTIATSTPGIGAELTAAGGRLRVLAVHPIAPNNGVAQWSRDLDLILATAKASRGPTLVVGDFNATVDHPQVGRLLRADYRDASAEAGLLWRPTWPSSDHVRLIGIRLPALFGLDHVFVRGPLEATDAHVQAVPGTDHRALMTRIAWTDARRAPVARQPTASP